MPEKFSEKKGEDPLEKAINTILAIAQNDPNLTEAEKKALSQLVADNIEENRILDQNAQRASQADEN